VLAPFFRYHAADAIGGGNGQGTERIAVQIDHAIRDGEPGFCPREIGHVFPWSAPRWNYSRGRRIISSLKFIA
jgi:hypothetical protein